MRKPIHLSRWLLVAWIPLLLLAGCSSGQASKKLVRKTVAKISPEKTWELVSYTTKSVARSGEDEKDKGLFIFGDRRLLLSFEADITAGIDLNGFNPKKDIILKRREKSVLIKLPEPTILTCDVESEKVKVEKEDRDWYRGKFTTEEVVHVAVQGKQTLLKEIADYKRYTILDDAKENARRTLTSMFKALGYEKVEVVFPSDEGQTSPKGTRSMDVVGTSGPEEVTETETEEVEAVG